MNKTLTEYLKTHEHQKFIAKPRYYKDADNLTYFCNEDRCYAVIIDKTLTVYKSIENDMLVGVKLFGVTQEIFS